MYQAKDQLVPPHHGTRQLPGGGWKRGLASRKVIYPGRKSHGAGPIYVEVKVEQRGSGALIALQVDMTPHTRAARQFIQKNDSCPCAGTETRERQIQQGPWNEGWRLAQRQLLSGALHPPGRPQPNGLYWLIPAGRPASVRVEHDHSNRVRRPFVKNSVIAWAAFSTSPAKSSPIASPPSALPRSAVMGSAPWPGITTFLVLRCPRCGETLRAMCNLYSITKDQQAIRNLAGAMRDLTGNLPMLPGVFPDYSAPIVRTAADGVRELAMARWGMPSPAFAIAGKKTDLASPTSATLNRPTGGDGSASKSLHRPLYQLR